jgi:purine-binding chemotaxis protein CheW
VPRKAKKVDEPTGEPSVTGQAAPPELAIEPEQRADFDDEGEDGLLAGAVQQAVTFQLAGQLYGLPIEVVQEIQQIAEFTPLPDTAPALLGLIDLRGTVVPAIDLRLLVGLEAPPSTLETPMIFCHVRGHLVCLIVDAVEDVIELPIAGIQPASGLYALADRMLGMCRLPQGLVLLLDIERLVPDSTLAAAEASTGES